MSEITSPVVRRRRLGHELRRLRQGKGLTCDQVGQELEWSGAKVSRIETGKVSAHPRDVRDLLDLYDVANQQERDRLLQIARDARQKGWWESYTKDFGTFIDHYVGMEAEATEILVFQLAIVPGLLQTEAYATAILGESGEGVSSKENDDIVAFRMTRQRAVLGRTPPPRYAAVIDEAVLRRQLAGRDVSLGQLQRLLAATEEWDIRIVPFSAGQRPHPQISFTILGFGDPADEDLVMVEHLTNPLRLENKQDVEEYRRTFQLLQEAALDAAESADLIRRVLEEAGVA
jgi:hypothetical protein